MIRHVFVHGWVVVVNIGVWDDLRFCLVYRVFFGLVWRVGVLVGYLFILDAGHFLDLR
jgi:hypothetical protein